MIYNSLYTIDFNDLKWRKCNTNGEIPNPVHCHSADIHNQDLYVYGGKGVNDEKLDVIYDNLYALEFDT
jgi:hypothetical protein